MRGTPWLAVGLCCALFAGCAENAVLEVDIVPATDTGVLYVDVASRDTPLSFEDARGGFGTGVDPIMLDLGETPHISVTADGDEITSPLYMGVSVCADAPPCMPTRVFRVERAFYLGQYTHLDLDLRRGGNVGTELEEIPICQIQGCGASEGNYCYDAPDGPRHFCDR